MFGDAFAADVQRVPAAWALFGIQPGARAQAVDDLAALGQLPQLYFQRGHIAGDVVGWLGGGVQGEGGGVQAGGVQHRVQAVQQLAAQSLVAAIQQQQLKIRAIHQFFAEPFEFGKLRGVQLMSRSGCGALDGKVPDVGAHGWASACWALR